MIDITIGKKTYENDDGIRHYYAKSEIHEDAPFFESPRQDYIDHTGLKNRRSMSISTYKEFDKLYQIYKLNSAKYPSCTTITTAMIAHISTHIAVIKKNNPNVVPGVSESKPIRYHLARLIWMEWWMKYAKEKYGNNAVLNIT